MALLFGYILAVVLVATGHVAAGLALFVVLTVLLGIAGATQK